MTIKGNLIDLAEAGTFDVIVHGCNCFHTMGAGIAKEISSRYPQALEVDKKYTAKGDRSKLGGFTHVQITGPYGNKFTIINMYTQYYYGKPKKGAPPLADYTAIKQGFQMLKRDYYGKRIGYPRIGAGLAGGDWATIQNIINTELNDMFHELVIL